jgi:hypothetical protein
MIIENAKKRTLVRRFPTAISDPLTTTTPMSAQISMASSGFPSA